APFVLTAQLPHIAHWLLPLYVLYWMLQYVNLAVRQVWEFVRLRLRGREDWLARARATHGEDPAQLHHLVVFPTYNESPESRRRSMGASADASADARNSTVRVTPEARAPVGTPDVTAAHAARSRGSCARFLTTRRPDGLPAAERVKGANLTWGGQYA